MEWVKQQAELAKPNDKFRCPFCIDGWRHDTESNDDYDAECYECLGNGELEFCVFDDSEYDMIFHRCAYEDDVWEWIRKLYKWEGWSYNYDEIKGIINNLK